MRIIYVLTLLVSLVSCSELEENKKLLVIMQDVNSKNGYATGLAVEMNTRIVKLTVPTDFKEPPVIFGKIILDFYEKADAQKVTFKTYKVFDQQKKSVMEFKNAEMKRILEVRSLFDKDLKSLNSQKMQDIYNRFDKRFIANLSYDELNSMFTEKIKAGDFVYTGFFLLEKDYGTLLVFNASGKISSVQIGYSFKDGNDNIFGVNILE